MPEAGLPQARIAIDKQSGGMSNALSAAWGALFGAGAVVLLALVLLIWKRPKRRDSRQLVPMDLGRNVSTLGTQYSQPFVLELFTLIHVYSSGFTKS